MSRPSFTPFDAAFWTLSLTAALVAAITLLHSISPRFGHVAVGGGVEVVLYTGASYLVLGRASRRPLVELGVTRAPLWLLCAGAALGVSLHGLTELVQSLVEAVSPTPTGVLEERLARLKGANLADRAALFAFVCVLSPAAEELFFRGALHARLESGYGIAQVAWTTSVLFTLSHFEPRVWPSLLVVALALALLRHRSASILPCYLLHALFNATTLLSVWFLPTTHGSSPPAMTFALVSCLVTAALVYAVVRRGPEELPGA
jgi:membrane protease YdiL (CAAX protease family)